MLSGPSTAFHYKKPPERPRSFGFPVIVPCLGCSSLVVLMTNPRNNRRCRVLLSKVAANESLVYSFDKYGPPHHHESRVPFRNTRA